MLAICGCGYNGFLQFDGFKCLQINESGQIVYRKDFSNIKTDKSNKMVLPEDLLQINKEFELENILFTWSRIAVTLKKDGGHCTTFITGFSSKDDVDNAQHSRAAVIVDKHSAAASTDTDVLLREMENPFKYKILQEKNAEFSQFNISTPNTNNAATCHIVCGGHRDFFTVYDSITFGKICQADAQAVTEPGEGNDRGVEAVCFNLHPIDSGIRIKEVSCGKEHALALSQFGTVYSYGLGSRGQLGHGSVEPEATLRSVEALEGVRMRSVCAGGWHSAAISEFGDLYMWGWNESGQLGIAENGSQEETPTAEECVGIQAEPRCVTLPGDLSISKVACGSRHSAVLTDTARVFTSGWNAYGQLGLGDTDTRTMFTEVVPVQGLCVNIFLGHWNSMFVCEANKQQVS